MIYWQIQMFELFVSKNIQNGLAGGHVKRWLAIYGTSFLVNRMVK
jgi:hypothetical protein